MPRRPANTVLLLTRSTIARADFTSAGASAGLWSQPRPEVNEWPTLVEDALALGPRAGAKVFVLFSDLWTQTLTLNQSAARMTADELAGALNFEAESLSGQSAFESMVAVQTLPAGNGYWIVQARTADFDHVTDILRKAGCKLGGLAHPGGMPIPLTKADGRWVRMELWPDAVLFLRGEAQGSNVVQVLNSDPQLGRWKNEWVAWCQGLGATEPRETLVGPGIAPPGGEAITLDDEAELKRWLAAWVQCLTGKAPAIPAFRPAPRPLSAALCWSVGLGLAVVVALGCFAVHRTLDRSVQDMNVVIKYIQDEQKKLDGVNKQIADSKLKQQEFAAQIDGIEKTGRILATHRQRMARLLTTLAELHPEDLVVEKIDLESGEPRLRGHCLQPELADQFANKLANALLAQGWEVQSPKKAAVKIAANGGPWSFDIQFASAKDLTLDTRVETKKGKGR